MHNPARRLGELHMPMRSLSLTLCLALAGCAAPVPRVYHYPNQLRLDVVVADQAAVDRSCRGGPDDYGRPVPHLEMGYPDANGMLHPREILVPGCWKPIAHELWVSWREGWEIFVHELCHVDGQPSKRCADYYP